MTYSQQQYKDRQIDYLIGTGQLIRDSKVERFYEHVQAAELNYGHDIESAEYFRQQLLDRIDGKQDEFYDFLPWETPVPFSFKPGDVTAYGGITTHGKSMLLSMIELSLMQTKRCCAFSLEMHPVNQLLRKLRQISHTDQPSRDLANRFLDWTIGRFWIYNFNGIANVEKLFRSMTYAVKALGVQHLVIDSLMKLDIGYKDLDKQTQVISNLCAFAEDTQTHVHIVMHPNKTKGQEEEVDVLDFMGSSYIVNQIPNIFVVRRNRKRERLIKVYKAKNGQVDAKTKREYEECIDQSHCRLICKKQRNADMEDEFYINLWFDQASRQFTKAKGRKIKFNFDYEIEPHVDPFFQAHIEHQTQ